MKVSFMEIHNEQLLDLLVDHKCAVSSLNSRPPAIRETPEGKILLQNIQQIKVFQKKLFPLT